MSTKKPSGSGSEAAKPPKFVRSPEYKEFYCNFAQLNYTAFDVSMRLGEAMFAIGVEPHVEERARISMAPLEAKVLERIFGNIVKQYEAQFGPINVPPGVMPEPFEK